MTTIKRKRKMKISALDFEQFDENIIFNILKRVEADTLYNLRVVNKQWYNLIFDTEFANSNLSHAEPVILLQTLVFGSYRLGFIEMKGGEIEVQDLNMSLQTPVRASCHGLVLLQDLPKRGNLSVGNLLTRKGIKIPSCIKNTFLGNGFGFTFIPQTREYKIVCFVFDMCIRSCVYMILTVGSNEWRQVNGPQLRMNYNEQPISINSLVHSLVTEDDQDFLFSIDTVDETSHKTELPYFGTTYCHGCHLMDLGGVLSLVRDVGGCAEVWVLEDFYKKEWIRRHCIKLQYETLGNNDYAPIGSLGNGKIILFVHTFAQFGSCYVADVELQQVKKLPFVKAKKLQFVKANRRHYISHLNSLISSKVL